jgi:hypothetical protein
MRFRTLFESQEILDMTHEIMTHHGMKHFGSDGSVSYHGPEDTVDHPALRDDLHALGWRFVGVDTKYGRVGGLAHPDVKGKYFHADKYEDNDGQAMIGYQNDPDPMNHFSSRAAYKHEIEKRDAG